MDSVNHPKHYEFQSTHPVRGATLSRYAAATGDLISIHAPREGCDRDNHRHDRSRVISIHAPREGCDACRGPVVVLFGISIHAPREGCDISTNATSALAAGFQSTHPVRGATKIVKISKRRSNISIHAPREGCDADF